METSWSLHLLSELLSAFSTEDPENLRHVLNRVAEAVDAEMAAIITGGQLEGCIGLAESERQLLLEGMAEEPPLLSIKADRLQALWAPLGRDDRLLVGRLGVAFDLEERSLLRAMARSSELSLSLMQAISAERQARLDASHQASRDALTGPPNRTLVLEELAALLDQGGHEGAGRAAGEVSVLFIDIDRFKWLNDAHGHAAGDALLVEVSRILRQSARRGDVVCRLSGDEFIVIAARGGEAAGAELAERIIAPIRQPIRIACLELSHTASVGISVAGATIRPPA